MDSPSSGTVISLDIEIHSLFSRMTGRVAVFKCTTVNPLVRSGWRWLPSIFGTVFHMKKDKTGSTPGGVDSGKHYLSWHSTCTRIDGGLANDVSERRLLLVPCLMAHAESRGHRWYGNYCIVVALRMAGLHRRSDHRCGKSWASYRARFRVARRVWPASDLVQRSSEGFTSSSDGGGIHGRDLQRTCGDRLTLPPLPSKVGDSGTLTSTIPGSTSRLTPRLVSPSAVAALSSGVRSGCPEPVPVRPTVRETFVLDRCCGVVIAVGDIAAGGTDVGPHR
jgi:hypothetical protein